MPKRIKLERRTGWRKPAGAIVVARPSRFANPFPVTDFDGDHAAAVAAYRQWLDDVDAQPVWCKTKWYPRPSREQIVAALRGHDLACWCRLDEPCHADVLLELANDPANTTAGTADCGRRPHSNRIRTGGETTPK